MAVVSRKGVQPESQPASVPVLPTGRTKSLAWAGLGTRPGVPFGLVGLVGAP
jgi:hypothetical protein